MKKYFTPLRLLGLLIWLIALIAVPLLLIYFAVIPKGTAFYPMGMIFPLIGLILFKSTSIRVGVVILAALAFFNLYRSSSADFFLDSLDHRIQSAFFEIRGVEKPSGDVVILDIDQKSLKELGQWPWPRTYLSRMIENLSAGGAKVIGLDIVLPNEDHQSLKHFSSVLQNLGVYSEGNSETLVSGAKVEKLVIKEYAKSNHLVVDDLTSDKEMKEKALSHYRKLNANLSLTDNEILLLMGKEAHELCYLDTDWKDDSVFSKGADLILDNDEKLAKTFSKYPVVGGGWIKFPVSSAGSTQKVIGPQANSFEGMVLESSFQPLKSFFPSMKKGYGQVLNHSVLQEGLNYQGAFNIIPEPSGAARYYSLALQAKYYIEALVFVAKDPNASRKESRNYEKQMVSEDFVYPSLALELLRVGGQYSRVQGKKISGLYYLELENDKKTIQIPVTKQIEVPINFLGFGGKWEEYYDNGKEYFFPYYSFVDVLKGRYLEGEFKNKYVIIGSTDPTLSDLIGSPFRAGFPGLEVHATMLDNILTARVLADYNFLAREWKYFGLIFIGLILVVLLSKLSPMWGGILTVTFLTFIPITAYFMMASGDGRFVFSFSYEWFSILILSSFVLLSGYFEVNKDRRFLQDQFGSMVSPAVLARLQADPKMKSLKGMKSDVTVAFSDIADFTTISETLSPQDLVSFLNKYFTPMTKIILEEHGYIDKFIGDAIMACWGVPFRQEDHHIRACRAVLQQQKCIEEIRPQLEKEFNQPLKVRFGIASGIVSSAMVGSLDRKNYTVLGDVVNTAARLEPLGKMYGVSIIVSHITYEKTKDEFEFRKLDCVIVKGKHQSIYIYELIGEKGILSEKEVQLKNLYEEAFEAYQDRMWERSKKLLNEIFISCPDDITAKYLFNRIEKYEKNPPSPGWKGGNEMLQK